MISKTAVAKHSPLQPYRNAGCLSKVMIQYIVHTTEADMRKTFFNMELSRLRAPHAYVPLNF